VLFSFPGLINTECWAMSGEVNRKIGKLVFLDNKRCKNKGAANSLRRLLIRHFPFFSKKKKKPNGFLEKP
jgi:hypothetical protein